MKSKMGIMAILGILMVVVFVSGCTNQDNNQTNASNTTNTSNTSAVKAFDVKATQTGPSTAKKGTSITINGSVTNHGSSAVADVKASGQDFIRNLGTLNPGQTQTFTYQVYIPTDKEVQADFGDNATVSNPLYIGGFAVTCTDSNGSIRTLNSNHLNINLS